MIESCSPTGQGPTLPGPMTLGIIQTGHVPEELEPAHGSYPDMFARLLSEADSSLTFKTFPAVDGVVPDDPHICDAWLITGSRHGVYEQLDWMASLEQFVRHTVQAGVPLIGICFGHQIIARALGGTVIKSDKGWGIGHHSYELQSGARNEAWLDSDDTAFTLNTFHQDQVVSLPQGARRLASSEFCENAIVAYGETVLTIQPHPEIDDDYQRDLIESRRTIIASDDRSETALQSLGKPYDAARVARWMTRFLRHARSARDASTSAEAAE